MLRYIIAVCIGLFCIDVWAQTWPSYAEAMERQMFEAKNRHEKQQLLIQKLDSAFSHDHVLNYQNEVWRDIQRLQVDSLQLHQQAAWLWNAAMLSFLAQDYAKSQHWWNRYYNTSADTTVESLLLGYLIALENDLEKAQNLGDRLCVSDSCFLRGQELIHFRQDTVKAKWPFVLASVLLPGSGLMVEGYWGLGIKAFMLNSAAAIAIISLIRANLYVNLVTWGLVLVEKLYLGQMMKTQDKAAVAYPRQYRKQFQFSNELVGEWLTKYPLNWKPLAP